jgi:type II secretory pathway pseudopilin PulG
MITGYIRYQKMKTNIQRWFSRLRVWAQDQRGLGLVESIVAVAILGSAVVTFISGLSAGIIAVREGDQEVVAQRLARTQLEYIKSCPYNTSYSKVDEPEGYTISVEVASIPDTDTDIQKITVTISREGDNILTVEGYKVNR